MYNFSYVNINKIFTLCFIKFNTYLYFVKLVSLTAVLMHFYKTPNFMMCTILEIYAYL